MHEVADRVALAQEFGVGGDVEIEVRPRGANNLGDAPAGADGHRGFRHDHRVAGQDSGHLLGGGVDVCKVGVAVAAAGRGADGDEDCLGAVQRGGKVAGEGQAAGLDVGGDELVKARLIDRHAAIGESGEFSLVGLDDGDLSAKLGEAGAGDETDIAAANHDDAHGLVPRCGCGLGRAQRRPGVPGRRWGSSGWLDRAEHGKEPHMSASTPKAGRRKPRDGKSCVLHFMCLRRPYHCSAGSIIGVGSRGATSPTFAMTISSAVHPGGMYRCPRA